MKKIFNLLLVSLAALLMINCKGDDNRQTTPDWPKSNHTLLIYMTADNDLSDYCATNLKSCINGLLNWETPINLVIYLDNWTSENGLPVLFQLKRNRVHPEKVDTIMIHQFKKDHNSADPEIMQAIIEEAFQACPAEIKGLELWSHGLGWVPGYSYKPTRAKENGTPATREELYIGIDGYDYLEVWDLRKALEKGPHFDYLVFDACNMAQAEVAYELRNIADYMLACPTEIMGEGLPYSVMVSSLSACNSKQQIVPSMIKIFEEFSTHYPGTRQDNGGTLSLLDLSKIGTLRENYKSLLATCDARRKLLEEKPRTYENYMQRFGRNMAAAYYHFYDMQSVADFMVNGNGEAIPQYRYFQDALKDVVIKEYHTSHFVELKINTCCGLGVGLPEVFGTLTYNATKILSAYNELQWSKD